MKQHLLNLYEKFGIVDGGERRRVAPARAAVHRGVVAVGDLHGREYRTIVAGSPTP